MSVVPLFQDFQRIFGVCPCCGELFRLSDAVLFHKSPPPRTPWDEIDIVRAKLERAEERLFNETERLRQKAQEAGRKEMERRLQAVTAFFRKQRIAIRDMRLLFHPVDYVAFRGISEGSCTSVEFIDREPTSMAHEALQRSIDQSIRAGNVSWITMRIGDNGQISCA